MALCLLMPAVMTACSTVRMPDLQTKVPVGWRNASNRRGTPRADLHGWWHAFHEPRLDALVESALLDNPDVAQAVERLRAARALYRHADAPFLPSLHLRTDDPVDPDASASYFTLGFDAQWELGLFGRRTAALRGARGDMDAAVADLQQARVTLVAEVVRNWIDLRAAQQRLQTLQRIRRTRQHTLLLTRRRQQLQLEAPSAGDRLAADLARAVAALAQPHQEANAAAQRLALLLGRAEPDPVWLNAGQMPRLGDASVYSTPADLLRTRPGIALAQAHVMQAAGQLGIARSQMYPYIGLGGSLVWSTSTLTHRESEFNNIASFGPVIDIPLFDWGLRAARAHAQDHQLKAAVFAYRKAVLAGVADVETALGNLAAQHAREANSLHVTDALDRLNRQQVTRQHLGLASDLQVDQGRLDRLQAQLELIDARQARDLAYVALFKALGGAPATQRVADQHRPAG